MAEEYLPGTPGERIRDLRKEAKLNQEEFAEAIGISRSTLGEIELDKRSISSTTALEIAKYFNVSVDFVLAKTDDPNVINYDLKVLGLTQEAADKLYTNQVDTGVLNLLIEHEKFGELMHLIAFYLKDINAEAKRTQNALYSTIADFLRKYGEDENADTVAAKKEPVYSADISKIQNCLNIILKETKDKLGDNTKEIHKEMKATVTELMKNKMRTNGALRKINADEFAGDVVNVITKSIALRHDRQGVFTIPCLLFLSRKYQFSAKMATIRRQSIFNIRKNETVVKTTTLLYNLNNIQKGLIGLFLKFKYWFDRQMEKGAGAMIKMLSAVTVSVIFVLVGLLFAFDWNKDGFFKSIWDVASATLNAWFPSSEDGNTGYLILCGIAALFGILFTSVLIGIISNLIEEKIDELQKGNSPVVEKGHFVILGFTPGAYTLISEIIAGCNREKCTIVVAEKTDKTEMHKLIESNINIPKRVRLICKNIDITDKNELELCSLDTCRSVTISPMDNHRTVKTMLAVYSAMEGAPEESKIIASVTDDNFIIPRNKRIIVFQANDAIGRIVAHCCTKPGSALAFNEIISFGGSEIYINSVDECVGMSFADILRCFAEGTPIGIKKGKRTLINPDAKTVYEENDKLIYLADTAKTYRINKSAPPSEVILSGETLNSKHGRIVVFGDSEVVETIKDEIPEDAELILESLKSAPSSEHLENIIKNADSVVLLRDSSVSPEEADINNIITLLKIREIKKKYNLNLAITTVLYNEQSRNLIFTKDPVDFVISSKTTSTILAQLAHNATLYRVFSEFLSNFGSEIYTKSMRNLALINQEMRVSDLRENLYEKGYLLLGFFFDGKEIELNPDSGKKICLAESDRLIVIADN